MHHVGPHVFHSVQYKKLSMRWHTHEVSLCFVDFICRCWTQKIYLLHLADHWMTVWWRPLVHVWVMHSGGKPLWLSQQLCQSLKHRGNFPRPSSIGMLLDGPTGCVLLWGVLVWCVEAQWFDPCVVIEAGPYIPLASHHAQLKQH